MTATKDKDGQGALRVLAADLEDVRVVAELAATAAQAAQDVAAEGKGLATSAHQAIAQVAEGLAKLNRQVADLAAATIGDDDEDEDKGQVSWLTIGDAQAAQVTITSLVEWLAQVYVGYPGGQLPECWAWHPSVVSELLGLRAVWLEAYRGRASSPGRVIDWLDRRPRVAKRVADELDGCSLSRHAANGDRAYRPARVAGVSQIGELADWWASSHGATGAPEPSKQLLQEEKARLDAVHQTRY